MCYINHYLLKTVRLFKNRKFLIIIANEIILFPVRSGTQSGSPSNSVNIQISYSQPITARGSGKRCKLPQRPPTILVHFRLLRNSGVTSNFGPSCTGPQDRKNGLPIPHLALIWLENGPLLGPFSPGPPAAAGPVGPLLRHC